jgi:hypothetical protein
LTAERRFRQSGEPDWFTALIRFLGEALTVIETFAFLGGAVPASAEAMMERTSLRDLRQRASSQASPARRSLGVP